MKITEIIEQIELIEKDHKIKPNPKRREMISQLIKKIHTLRSRIHNTTDDEKLKARQAHLYGEIQLLINTMKHPKPLIDALSKQRFFTIKQHPSLLLDTVTGILFPRNSADFVYSSLSLSERNRVLKDFELSGLQDWEFPKEQDLQKLFDTQIEKYSDITYTPTSATINNWQKVWINGKDVDSVFDMHRLSNGFFGVLHNNNTYLTNSDYALFFPINKSFKPAKYIYGSQSEPSKRLALFLYNANLTISFPEAAIENLYKLFYVDYLNLHLQLVDDVPTTVTTKSSPTPSPVSISSFNSATYKQNNVTSINSYCPSAIAFLKAAESYLKETDESLKLLHENIAAASKDLLEQPKITFLQSSLHLLVSTLSIQGNHPLAFIYDAKQNVITLQQQLNAAKTYNDLLAIEQQQKVSYPLLVEFSEKIIQDYVAQISYLGANTEVIKKLTVWYKTNIETIQQRSSEEMKLIWQAEAIDAEDYEQWILEMDEILQSKYELFIPILKDLLANKISYATFEKLDATLQTYIHNICTLFQKERVQVHQKFAFQLGGELQEKLEVQTLLYKLVSPVITNIHDFMKECPTEEQKSITTILKKIIEAPINHLDNLVANYTFVQDILEEFHTLKQAQLENFTEDTQHFIEQQQQRDARYNALMYKMRKQLLKQ